MKTKISYVLIIVMALVTSPASAEEVRNGNGLINPDTQTSVIADYQFVVTDGQGNVVAVGSQAPSSVPQGYQMWNNNGSWGDVKVGGIIKNTAQGNLYAPPGVTITVPAPVVSVALPSMETSTATTNSPASYDPNIQVVEPIKNQTSVVAVETATATIETTTATIETRTATIETTTATSLEIARLNAKIVELETLLARIMEFFKGWLTW
jgi:hypothetical protein